MKKKTIWAFLLLFLIALCVALVFINRRSNGSNEKNVVRIGAVLPLTGKAAGVGTPAKEGLMLAEQYINDSILKDSNVRIEIYCEDGEGIPAKSLSALNKLRTHEKCNIVFSIVSAVDLSIVPLQSRQHFLFISHASHPQLSNVNDFVFRHSQTVEQEFNLIDNAINGDWENTSYIYSNDDYGVSFGKLIKDRQSNLNEYAIDPNDVINKAVIDKILKSNPKNIVINGNAPTLMPVVNALKDKMFKGNLYACMGFAATGGISQDLGDLNLYYVDFTMNDIAGNNDLKTFRSLFGESMGANQIIFFNSALLIGKAIKEGNNTPEMISKYLKKVKTFDGVSEKISINDSNDILPPISLINFK